MYLTFSSLELSLESVAVVEMFVMETENKTVTNNVRNVDAFLLFSGS